MVRPTSRCEATHDRSRSAAAGSAVPLLPSCQYRLNRPDHLLRIPQPELKTSILHELIGIVPRARSCVRETAVTCRSSDAQLHFFDVYRTRVDVTARSSVVLVIAAGRTTKLTPEDLPLKADLGDAVGQLSGNRVGLNERDSNVRDEFVEIRLGPAVDNLLRLEQASRSFGKASCGRSRSRSRKRRYRWRRSVP